VGTLLFNRLIQRIEWNREPVHVNCSTSMFKHVLKEIALYAFVKIKYGQGTMGYRIEPRIVQPSFNLVSLKHFWTEIGLKCLLVARKIWWNRGVIGGNGWWIHIVVNTQESELTNNKSWFTKFFDAFEDFGLRPADSCFPLLLPHLRLCRAS
jgi:hypothetical protein